MRRDIPIIRSLLICASIAVQGACVAPSQEAVEEARDGGTRYLFSASTVIEDEWQQLRFLGHYSVPCRAVSESVGHFRAGAQVILGIDAARGD